MPRVRIPRYRHYKPKNLGMVVIRGKAHYLGKYGTEESLEEYRRLIADFLSTPATASPVSTPSSSIESSGPTINELLVAYWERFVGNHYVKDGRPTSEQDNIKQALRFLRKLHGHSAAGDFGPKALALVREAMIQSGRCRKLINKDINRIRGMFRWAVEEELFPGPAYQALRAVKGLAKGRSHVKERPPVGQVPEVTVRATLPFLPAPVAALVELQLLTGARPGEVTALRPCDVDRSDPEVWIYRPSSHKTEHLGRERVILLGSRAQGVLLPWLDRDADWFCFRPVEAVAERNAKARAKRKSPPKPSRVGQATKPLPKRAPGERYTKDSLRWAIRRACLKAKVTPWTPHQLRHTRATQIRKEFGIEAAQVILGHSKADTTAIYAERDLGTARRIMGAIG